jgi:hypothetical protein
MDDGVKGSKCVDLLCDRTHLSQAGEIASDDGFGPGKPAMRCFSAFDVACM